MLTNFQNEVEDISTKAKKLLSQAQSRIDIMKAELSKVPFPNRSEKQSSLGKVECLTFKIVTATKKFKAALKSSWDNIKKIEERKKRLTFSKPLPNRTTVVKKASMEYASVPTQE